MIKKEMKDQSSKCAWYVASVFFFVMLLHNADKFLISPLLPMIQEEFNLSYTQLGAIQTGSIIVAVIFMPIWGYLFDKYARPPIVALASAIWGITTIFSTLSRNYFELVITRALTGIDNQATSGLISLIGDYFPPSKWSTAVGLLYTSNSLGTMVGVIVGSLIGYSLGWRSAFLVTAVPGVLLAILVLLTVKDRPRGATQEELLGVAEQLKLSFSFQAFKDLVTRKSAITLFVQGFFGVFPWQILEYWLFTYMSHERGMAPDESMIAMLLFLVGLTFGYIIAGILGDQLYKKFRSGRMIFSAVMVFIGMLIFDATILSPSSTLFLILGFITTLTIPIAGPNVAATVQEISLPEVRATALATLTFFENVGSATAPLITGYFADNIGLTWAIVTIVTVTWSICSFFLGLTAYLLPKDVVYVKQQLKKKAESIK
jgi:predicted MFS family arabinose efflux permease